MSQHPQPPPLLPTTQHVPPPPPPPPPVMSMSATGHLTFTAPPPPPPPPTGIPTPAITFTLRPRSKVQWESRANARTSCFNPQIVEPPQLGKYLSKKLCRTVAFIHYRVAGNELRPSVVGAYDLRDVVPSRSKFRPTALNSQHTPVYKLPTDAMQLTLSFLTHTEIVGLLPCCKYFHYYASSERIHEQYIRSVDPQVCAALHEAKWTCWFDYATTVMKHDLRALPVSRNEYDTLLHSLKTDTCCYVVLDMSLVRSLKDRLEGSMFVLWTPNEAPIFDRVQHAACVGAARQHLSCVADVQATDLSECTQYEVAARVPRRFRP
eukprot:PhF_6_TR32953/c0_g1_i2/m.48488